jgi:DNA-binding LytR/AlgR family response regulator
MDFVKSLAVPPLIVFTTAYSEYAVEGFRVNAVDYLLKPFGLQDFQRAAQRLRERLALSATEAENSSGDTPADNTSPTSSSASAPLQSPAAQSTTAESPLDDTIFLKTEYRIVKVTISSIRYVEAMSEYLKVWLAGEKKPIVTLLSMKKMEERLPAYFMRIHRSYIVNLREIQEVNKNRIILDSDTYLPVGDMYRDSFQQYLDTKFLGK